MIYAPSPSLCPFDDGCGYVAMIGGREGDLGLLLTHPINQTDFQLPNSQVLLQNPHLHIVYDYYIES